MKKFWLISFIVFTIHHSPFTCIAQEIPATAEQQLENLTNVEQNETEDDSYLQQLEHFKKHPLDLNAADAGDLEELVYLTGLQIDNLVVYRNLLGRLISIYELQAVPGWDIATIKKILPYVTVGNFVSLAQDLGKRVKNGDHCLLFRVSEVLERANGFDNSITGPEYAGGRQRIFARYRYQYKNLLQYGLTADKDAGEQFLKGSQKYGFDFYSFHFFARKLGRIQALALGDFTVNMGQGLVQWQGPGFKKSTDVLGVKRQSTVLRPYNSSGEFYFHRGAGITIESGKIETTTFASIRKLSANFVTDTVTHENFISSFLNSGYHRTAIENADRNNLRQLSVGGNIIYHHNHWHIGLNTVYYNFSFPVQKRNDPYNAFAINGKSWSNFSVDYSYTFRNLHFFGEAAADKNLHTAFINGLLISADPCVDLSVVQRSISQEYQAVYGNAFTENTYPTNEKGLYAGISIRPAADWKLDMYADVYKFPWLKYLADAPGYGKDFLAQLIYTAGKQLEIYSRYRCEAKQSNQPDNNTVTNYLVLVPKQGWRTQLNYKTDRSITLRSRIEMLWYDKGEKGEENGFLVFFDLVYKPLLKPYSGNIRLQYFETDDYNSRIYAYENDVLFSYSIPAFYDKGYRYYINISYDLKKKFSVWLRLAQTIYRGKNSIGSGPDEINCNHKTEIKLQACWFF